MKRTKTYEISSFKTLPEEGPGKFQAVVSVFGNVDFQGDRVVEGAFAKTLKNWKSKGLPIPVIWAHEWLNPDAHIGYVNPEDAEELLEDEQKSNGGGPGGLLVKGTMDVHKPFAAQVFDLLKERRVREWSFAYDIVREDKADDGANELLELELLEVGPCLKGANPETYTVSAKSAAEAELKEAHQAERSLGKFLEVLEKVDDMEIAQMLTKTQLQGSAPAPERAFKANDDGSVPLEIETKSPATTIIDESILEGPHVDEGKEGRGGSGTKPWHIEKRGLQFCVIKDEDSSEVACHDTREDAEAQLRALYASEKTDDEEKTVESDDTTMTSNTSNFDINYNITNGDNETTWTITLPDGAKAGRVIGAKAADSLKTRLTEAVDMFVKEINGQVNVADDEQKMVEEPTEDPDADIKARLNALIEGEN